MCQRWSVSESTVYGPMKPADSSEVHPINTPSAPAARICALPIPYLLESGEVNWVNY
jgi:hypothetical protein